MSEYREECIERKAVQIGMVEQRPVSRAKKKKRGGEFVVECRRPPNTQFAGVLFKPTDWKKWRAYKTQDIAERAVASFNNKYNFLEFRLAPNTIDKT